MAEPVLTIARTATRLWRRDVAAQLRIGERQVVLGVATAGVLAGCFGALLALIVSGQLQPGLPEALHVLVLRNAYSSTVVSTAIIVSVLCMTAPPHTALQTLLDLLPVGRASARIGQLMPLLAIGLLFAAALSGTSIAVTAAVLDDPLRTLWSAVLQLVVLVAIELLAVGLFTLVDSALGRATFLPHPHRVALAGSAVITGSLLVSVGDIVAMPVTEEADGALEPASLLMPRAAAALVLDPGDLVSWGVLLAWLVGSGLILRIAGSLAIRRPRRASTRLLVGLRPAQGVPRSAVWLEVLTAARAPQTVIAVILLVPLVGVAARFSASPLLSGVSDALATTLPALPLLLGVYAVGRTLPIHWTGAQISARSSWWILPKMLGTLLVGSVLAVPVVLVEGALGLVHVQDLVVIAGCCALAASAALLGGALLPYSEEQSVSTAVAGAAVTLLTVGGTLLAGWVGEALGRWAVLVTSLSIAVVFGVLYAAVSLRLSTRHAARD
ncbi:hypothetical protein NB037_09155 [Rathayibacter sp. ZW T2_19]|uniref:Uncharacterized protein n=1 Tax=Rathayibacter rubneri TaxID=2950106 RepID=A0A9X2ISD7_9MICO|nr:hypothetical protein [Rathayibacter rubneri]MCM6762581.1 hypothetical protein [Rathayibacter rubneri]